MTRACPNAPTLSRLLDGELTRNDEARVRVHVDGCPACRVECARLRQLLGDLAAPIPGLPSDGSVERVMAAVRAGRMPDVRVPGRRPWAFFGGGFALAAACLLVLILTGRFRPVGEDFVARGSHTGCRVLRRIPQPRSAAIRVPAGVRR